MSNTVLHLAHITLDIAGVYERRREQLERFSTEVLPLLRDFRK